MRLWGGGGVASSAAGKTPRVESSFPSADPMSGEAAPRTTEADGLEPLLQSTFAEYLAKHLAVRRGLVLGAPREAAEIAQASDIVLSGYGPNGGFEIISIIDRDTGKVLRALPKQAEIVVLLDVSADGRKAAALYPSAERFNDIDQVRLWDLRNGTVLASFHKPGVTIIGGASVDDHYLFTTSAANELTVWSLR